MKSILIELTRVIKQQMRDESSALYNMPRKLVGRCAARFEIDCMRKEYRSCLLELVGRTETVLNLPVPHGHLLAVDV